MYVVVSEAPRGGEGWGAILISRRDCSVGNELVLRLAAHLCRVNSSLAGDIRTRLCVNGCQFPTGYGGFAEYIYQSLYNWKLPGLSSNTELSSEVIVRCDWFRVNGRRRRSHSIPDTQPPPPKVLFIYLFLFLFIYLFILLFIIIF